jgi:hypothetical protein
MGHICCFFYMFFDANCVMFSSTSATAGCGFFSANCTGLVATSTAGPGTSWNGYTATSQQADNSNSSKDLFQFPGVHVSFSLIKVCPFPFEKDRIGSAYNDCPLT